MVDWNRVYKIRDTARSMRWKGWSPNSDDTEYIFSVLAELNARESNAPAVIDWDKVDEIRKNPEGSWNIRFLMRVIDKLTAGYPGLSILDMDGICEEIRDRSKADLSPIVREQMKAALETLSGKSYGRDLIAYYAEATAMWKMLFGERAAHDNHMELLRESMRLVEAENAKLKESQNGSDNDGYWWIWWDKPDGTWGIEVVKGTSDAKSRYDAKAKVTNDIFPAYVTRTEYRTETMSLVIPKRRQQIPMWKVEWIDLSSTNKCGVIYVDGTLPKSEAYKFVEKRLIDAMVENIVQVVLDGDEIDE